MYYKTSSPMTTNKTSIVVDIVAFPYSDSIQVNKLPALRESCIHGYLEWQIYSRSLLMFVKQYQLSTDFLEPAYIYCSGSLSRRVKWTATEIFSDKTTVVKVKEFVFHFNEISHESSMMWSYTFPQDNHRHLLSNDELYSIKLVWRWHFISFNLIT